MLVCCPQTLSVHPFSATMHLHNLTVLSPMPLLLLFSCSVVSNSQQPHGLSATRLLCPWDFPGKNTGVGCHFLLQCMKVKSESEVAQSCPTLSNPTDCSLPGSSIHGIFQAGVLEWVLLPSTTATVWAFQFTIFIQDFSATHQSYHNNHSTGKGLIFHHPI